MKKRFWKKAISMVVAAALGISLLTACGSSSGSSSDSSSDTSTASTSSDSAADEDPIILGMSAYPAYYWVYIADKEGFFEKEGLNVQIKYFSTYSDSIQAFSAGQLDCLCQALPDAIAPYINGVDFKITMILDNSNGADGLVATKDITSLTDLKGKTVATEYGSIEHFFLLHALDSVGMTQDDINFVNMDIAASGSAFLSGSVDAASLWEPSLSTALNGGNANELISSEETPGLIVDVFSVSGDMDKNRPEQALALTNAYYDAMDFYCENPDQAIKDMAAGAEISEDEMKTSMAGAKLFGVQDAINTMTNEADDYSYAPYDAAQVADFLKSVNLIDSVPEDTADLFDAQFLEQVLKDRGDVQVPDTKALLNQ